ncbi:MAG: CRISPR-associated protein Cas4 [Bacteroidota bacterium]
MITGTHFNYYQICHRKLWLFSSGISMEHTSDIVYEGKLIHETSYPQRTEKYQEIEIGGIKIDYYDAKNKVIHEVKKSDKIEKAHEWQLKYYIYILEKTGINGVTGILEYPKLRKTDEILLSERDKIEIEEMTQQIQNIINSDECPQKVEQKCCKKCSYFDFCFSG